MTRLEVLSSCNPVPGFQGGAVRHTTVTKMEKIGHGFGHYSSYTFYPIWPYIRTGFVLGIVELFLNVTRFALGMIGFVLNIN